MAKISFKGNIGKKDAALRKVEIGGKEVAVCDVFVCENVKSGENTRPVWYKVTLWREYADRLAKYLTSGRYLMVEGEISRKPHVYTVGTEVNAYVEVNAREITFLDNKGKQESATPEDGTEIATADTDEQCPW